MTGLKVNSIAGKGNLSEECVWLEVLEDVTNLDRYIICDSTYTDNHHISNELRHMYWFANKSLRKGDWIRLMTKDGTNTSFINDRKTTTHVFHWKLGRTIWNKDGDAAVLFNISTWSTTKA